MLCNFSSVKIEFVFKLLDLPDISKGLGFFNLSVRLRHWEVMSFCLLCLEMKAFYLGLFIDKKFIFI